MPTPPQDCHSARQQHPPKRYEPELNYIIHTYGRAELTLWVLENGTEHERVWWWSRILEAETGEEIPHALDAAALGELEALAIRVAGHRLKEKLVKAFLDTKPEQKKAHHPTYL